MEAIMQDLAPETLALHADGDVSLAQDVAAPIHVSTNFKYTGGAEDLIPIPERETHDPRDFYYSRIAAPTTVRFETVLSSLLHGEAVTFASGQAACHAALLLLNPRRVAIAPNAYFGVHGVIDAVARLSGLTKLPLDCPAEQLEAGDLVILETPLSPSGTAFNIAEHAEKAHSRGAFLLVSSTLAPPGLQDPFAFGADLVHHSGSKYIGGHHDAICGVLATKRSEWTATLKRDRQLMGSTVGNLEAWLCLRSLRTLSLRVKRQSETTVALVAWLKTGLDDSSDDDAAAIVKKAVSGVQHTSLQATESPWILKQMPNGYGSVFSITMKSEQMARAMPSSLKLVVHATSLGGVESSLEWRKMSDTKTDPRLLRFSIGLEELQDLKNDLLAGFQQVASRYPIE